MSLPRKPPRKPPILLPTARPIALTPSRESGTESDLSSGRPQQGQAPALHGEGLTVTSSTESMPLRERGRDYGPGRSIPRAFMRDARVVGLIPRSAAAPPA